MRYKLKTIVLRTFLLFPLLSINAFPEYKDSNFYNTVSFHPEYQYKILDQNQNLRKVNLLLTEKKKGKIKENQLIIGTSLITLLDYQKSNVESKFGYLMRHPTANNQIGKEVSEAVIHSFQMSVSGLINKWITTYAEFLYNPQQSFGSGTIVDLNRNQIQIRRAFVIFGNLNESSFYESIH